MALNGMETTIGTTVRLPAVFRAETPEEAIRLAKEWIHAEPNVRLRTICSVRPAVRSDGARWPGVWTVTLAIVPRVSPA